MKLRDFGAMLRAAGESWVKDYAQSMGAALAFYTMFSIAPLLLIVISVAGVVFGEDAARGEIYHQLEDMLGSAGASAVQTLLEQVWLSSESVLATVFGVVLLFIGATSVFAELQDALDRIWRVPHRAPSSGLWPLLRARLLSFGMILGLGFLLIVSLAMSTALAAVGRWWDPQAVGWLTIANAIEVTLSVAFVTCIFAMIYKVMPRAGVAWRDVWVGAAFTSMLFLAGKFLIGVYIGHSRVSSLYGATASLVIVLLWVYYSAQIFLFGAEFTWVYSHRFGSRKGQPRASADPPPAA